MCRSGAPIPAGLFILDFMLKTGKSASELLAYLYSKVGEHYYDRIDVHFKPEQREQVNKRMSKLLPNEIAGIKVSKSDSEDGFVTFWPTTPGC